VRIRNGLGKKPDEFVQAVGAALQRGAGKRQTWIHICEDCGLKVARGLLLAEGEEGRPPRRSLPRTSPTLHRISCKPLRN
jgi:hypothetical protein